MVPTFALPLNLGEGRASSDLATCMMIATAVYMLLASCMRLPGANHATQELRIHDLPDRPQPGARRRVVEHPDPARRLPRADPLRPVPEEPRHRAEHADAAAQCAGRVRPAGAPALQRASAAPRICADRARPRLPAGAVGAARLGQPPLRARGRQRHRRRYRDRRAGRSGPGGPPQRQGDGRTRRSVRSPARRPTGASS